MHRREFIRTGSLAAATLLAARPLRAALGSSRLRVVQIGTAHSHAPEKWQTLQRMSEIFDVAGIWEPDTHRQAKVAAESDYRGARWLTEVDVFGDRSIRAAVVETELPDLLTMGARCLEAGWHLHLDKPAGADLAAFAALQQTAAHAGLVLQLGYMLRYNPAVRFCFEAYRQGWLGEIFSIHGDMGKVIGLQRREWLANNYGGSMMLLGCHLLDLTIALLGRPGGQVTHRRQTRPEHDRFFDYELAVLEYPRAMATLRSMLTEVGGEDRRQFVVCGSKGTVEILPLEPGRVRLSLQEAAGGFRTGSQDVALPVAAERYDAMLADFANQVAGRPLQVLPFTPTHDLLTQEILLAIAARPVSARAPTNA